MYQLLVNSSSGYGVFQRLDRDHSEFQGEIKLWCGGVIRVIAGWPDRKTPPQKAPECPAQKPYLTGTSEGLDG